MTVMKESVARPLLMQDYAGFAPIDPVRAPQAYLVPNDGTRPALVDGSPRCSPGTASWWNGSRLLRRLRSKR